jgi:hypothetical protein
MDLQALLGSLRFPGATFPGNEDRLVGLVVHQGFEGRPRDRVRVRRQFPWLGDDEGREEGE